MKYLIYFFILASANAYSGSFATPAVPTSIDIERGNGFMVYGQFGNPEECSYADRFYVESSHPQYKEIYSTVLAAYMSGKKINAYISACKTRGWYVTPDKTFNTLTSAGSLYLR